MPLFFLAYVAYVSIALPDNVGGITWPLVRLDLGQPIEALGVVVPFGVAGYVVSSSSTAFLLARTGVGWLLALSAALSAGALAVYALAQAFWVVLFAVFLGGLASGAIDAALNAYAVRHFGARRISWMHACFCVGAAAGPVAATGLLADGRSWRWVYAGLAALQALLAVTFAGSAKRWIPSSTPAPAHRAKRPRSGPRTLWPSLAAFALQSGIEAGTGIWAYVHLTAGRGMPDGPAGLTVAGFWGAMFVGRIVVGHGTKQGGTRRSLLLGVSGMLLGAVLVAVPGPAWPAAAGVVVIGLAAAPMFPLLTLTTSERVGEAAAERVIGLQMATSSAAGAVLPGAVAGALVGAFGVGVIGGFLVVLAGAMCLLYRRL
ncbi:MFS transporter [Nonomuraea sp. NPDC052265]|uniref:MFS transporter n=1 Tax=Nonomuraea sp. NPDC052265 TaxID=3364374 RepID=UPI0037C6F10C